MDEGSFEFDARNTGGTLFLDQDGDKVGRLKADVFPPVGTQVNLPSGKHGEVKAHTLDFDASGLAQVMVSLHI
ncbi:hypothetical protein [Glutamicibacter sp. NPDC087583]